MVLPPKPLSKQASSKILQTTTSKVGEIQCLPGTQEKFCKSIGKKNPPKPPPLSLQLQNKNVIVKPKKAPPPPPRAPFNGGGSGSSFTNVNLNTMNLALNNLSSSLNFVRAKPPPVPPKMYRTNLQSSSSQKL